MVDTNIDKLRASQNYIGKTTSFSGSDIQVIAYRGLRSPAEQFSVDKIKQEIDDKKGLISAQRVRLKEKENQLASAKSAVEQNARRIKELKSVLPDGSSAANALTNKEGKLQNQVSEHSQELQSLTTELKDMEDSLFQSELEDEELSTGSDEFFELGSIHTLSYSSFREKFAVRTLGRIQAKTYTRGPRTLAGTMVFNTLQTHELMELVNIVTDLENKNAPNTVMLDQLQKFNLLLLFANEYGAYSALHLLDIDINSEGQEMSVDSIITHNTINFYAKEMIPMINIGNRFNSYDEMILGTIREVEQLGFTSGKTPLRKRIDSFNNPFSDEGMSELISKSRGLF